MYAKAARSAIRNTMTSNPIILEIGTGMYAHMMTMVDKIMKQAKIDHTAISIESNMSASGKAASKAAIIMEKLGGHLVKGHSTDGKTVKEATNIMNGSEPDIAISETIGDIFSSGGYPYTYSRPWRMNL